MSDKNKHPLIHYQWTGVNHKNEQQSGIIQAYHILIAKNTLSSQGIRVKKISKNRTPWMDYLNKKITQGDIAVFNRQLATLISAGVPLVQSLEIMSAAYDNPMLAQLIYRMKHDIETGKTLTEALHQHPRLFNELVCQLIDVGEKSGCLDLMLTQLATYQEKIEWIKKKIKKAITYPIFILVVSCLVTSTLLVSVVPQFQVLFAGFGAKLPFMTRIIITLSQFFKHYWATFLIFILASLALFLYTKKHSPQFAYKLERGLLALPVIGVLMHHAAIARLTRTLSITFAAG